MHQLVDKDFDGIKMHGATVKKEVHLYVYFCDSLWSHSVFSLPQTSVNEDKITGASILFGML